MANTITATYEIIDVSPSVKILGNADSVNSFTINGTEVDISSSTSSYTYTFPSVGTHTITFTLKDNLTSLADLFNLCGKLTSVSFDCDTSNVTDLTNMLNYCKNLTTVNVSNFDTSNVTDMTGVFSNCKNLTNLTLGNNWKTYNVTDMSYMFYDCLNLTSLDVSGFNTSKVTDMKQMFRGCETLTTLDLSNFDTSNVTDMNNMFLNCKNLTSLNVSNFNTSNVTSMSHMFSNCDNLTSLDVSNFNTSNVTSMMYMFGCKNLTSLDVSNFDTSNVTDMYGMFMGCQNLTYLDLSNFNTSNQTDTRFIFNYCISLKKIILGDIGNLDSVAFKDCPVEEIYCKSLTAPLTSEDTFDNIKTGGTLYYPTNGIGYNDNYWTELYNTYGWNRAYIDSIQVTLDASVEGGTYAIEATNTGTWTVGEHPTWIIPSATSGTGLSLKVLNNTSLSQRTATVVMTSGDASISINVVQAALEVSWEKTPIVTVDNAGGEFSINLNYNAKPESFELYTKDWVTANYTLYDNYVNIYGTVDPIGGNVNRSDSIYAKLKYAYGEYGTTNSIRQIGSNYTVTPQDINIPETGGSVTITITSDYSLNGYDSASSLYGTTTFNRVSDTEIQVICDIPANTGDARTEVPYLTSTISGFNTIPLTSIIQDAGGTNPDVEWNINTYFEINSTATTPTNQTATLSAQIPYSSSENLGTLEVVFDSNWVKTTDQGWENGEGYITIQAEDNRLGVNRRAVMTLYSPTYNQTREVTIVQSGLEVSIEKEYSVKCSGGDLIIECECNSWIAQNELEMEGVIGTNVLNIPFMVNDGYITTEPSQIIATIPANESTEDRNIKLRLYVTTMDVYYEINVSQPACSLETPVLYFKEKYIKLPLKGGTVYVTLVSNIDWTTKWEI